MGDKAWIAGPRGSFTIPFTFDWHLLIADDTGLPALARRLEEMPKGTRVVALIEVETEADRLDLATKADASIIWVTQEAAGGADHDALTEALRTLELPEGDFFSWVACEIESGERPARNPDRRVRREPQMDARFRLLAARSKRRSRSFR
ncbi:siderophore-interacting protein [Rhizobium sp. AN68]|uniref:siderophore-interacting protein n=1 Tax=Rhizobium sp. AN68 TaxID=3035122 RepID=UPI003A5999F9